MKTSCINCLQLLHMLDPAHMLDLSRMDSNFQVAGRNHTSMHASLTWPAHSPGGFKGAQPGQALVGCEQVATLQAVQACNGHARNACMGKHYTCE